jgi:hypothetical protein
VLLRAAITLSDGQYFELGDNYLGSGVVGTMTTTTVVETAIEVTVATVDVKAMVPLVRVTVESTSEEVAFPDMELLKDVAKELLELLKKVNIVLLLSRSELLVSVAEEVTELEMSELLEIVASELVLALIASAALDIVDAELAESLEAVVELELMVALRGSAALSIDVAELEDALEAELDGSGVEVTAWVGSTTTIIVVDEP